MAFKRYLKVNVKVQPPHKGRGAIINTVGTIAKQLPLDNSNIVSKALDQVFAQDRRLMACLNITIETEIPIGSGLGASSASAAAGITAGLALSGQQLEKGLIFAEAAKFEGQASGVGAAIFGGFMLCAPNIVPGDIIARRLKWPDNWSVLGIIPPYTIPAKKLRSVLPASVSHKDATYNVQKTALLIEAVIAVDEEAMKAALKDKLSEPYKAKLVPELSEVRKLLHDYDVLGTVLSGNGPGMLTFVDRERKDDTMACLRKWAETQNNGSQIEYLELDEEGLLVSTQD